jgi:hypothetical protein
MTGERDSRTDNSQAVRADSIEKLLLWAITYLTPNGYMVFNALEDAVARLAHHDIRMISSLPNEHGTTTVIAQLPATDEIATPEEIILVSFCYRSRFDMLI